MSNNTYKYSCNKFSKNKNMAVCHYFILFYYDCCFTILILFGNKFDQINEENYIYSIARYYYIHYWDRHLDDKPPFVGFTAKYDLQIATLVNRKSFKTKTKILKTLKYGDIKQYFRYSCAKYSWCIDINLLKVKEHNESL